MFCRHGLFVFGVCVIFALSIYPLIFISLLLSDCLPDLHGTPCNVECIHNESCPDWSIRVCYEDTCCNPDEVSSVCRTLFGSCPINYSFCYFNYDTSCVNSVLYDDCLVPYYAGLICNHITVDIGFLSIFILVVFSGVSVIIFFPTLIYDCCKYLCGKLKKIRPVKLKDLAKEEEIDSEEYSDGDRERLRSDESVHLTDLSSTEENEEKRTNSQSVHLSDLELTEKDEDEDEEEDDEDYVQESSSENEED